MFHSTENALLNFWLCHLTYLKSQINGQSVSDPFHLQKGHPSIVHDPSSFGRNISLQKKLILMLFAGEGRLLPSPRKKKPSSPAQKARAENKIYSGSGGHIIMQKFTSAKRGRAGQGRAGQGRALHFSKHPNSFFLVFPIIPARYHGKLFFLLLFSMVLLRQVMPPFLGGSYFYYVAYAQFDLLLALPW